MKMLVIALLSTAGFALAQAASAPVGSARDRHAAECVAALQVNTEDLARQVKAGKEASRSLLMDRLVAGAAFVGDTYLHGDADEQQARALNDQALEAQKSLPAAELASRTVACANEGSKLFNASNSVQQAIVKRLAKRRMRKLLGS